MSIAEKLNELGIVIPQAAKPLAAYIPAVKSGDLVYTSGQLPTQDGKLVWTGKVGDAITAEQGAEAARLCALNCLAALNTVSSVENVVQILKVTGFVNSAAGFTDQPTVMNGASELVKAIFGDSGVHARSAIGMAELPRNASVEVEMIFRVRE